MCFHNALSKTATEIENRFEARFRDKTLFKPIYHGSGFTFMYWPVITQEEPCNIDFLRWGLIPFWVKHRKDADTIRALTLNAKGETLNSKPSFKYSVKEKRCLILSSGFYEWQHLNNKKIPHFIFPKEKTLMAMGGLYSTWTDKDTGEIFKTFSIITTQANNLLSKIHNTKKRMPLIFPETQEKIWIDSKLSETEIANCIKPLDDGILEAYTVSPLISSLKQNSNMPQVQAPYLYPELNQIF